MPRRVLESPFPRSGSHTITDCECPALRIRVPYAEKEVLKGCLKEVKGGLNDSGQNVPFSFNRVLERNQLLLKELILVMTTFYLMMKLTTYTTGSIAVKGPAKMNFSN